MHNDTNASRESAALLVSFRDVKQFNTYQRHCIKLTFATRSFSGLGTRRRQHKNLRKSLSTHSHLTQPQTPVAFSVVCVCGVLAWSAHASFLFSRSSSFSLRSFAFVLLFVFSTICPSASKNRLFKDICVNERRLDGHSQYALHRLCMTP